MLSRLWYLTWCYWLLSFTTQLSTAASSTTDAAASSSQSAASTPSSQDIGLIIGLAVGIGGGTIVILVIVNIVLCCMRARKQTKNPQVAYTNNTYQKGVQDGGEIHVDLSSSGATVRSNHHTAPEKPLEAVWMENDNDSQLGHTSWIHTV